MSTASPSIGTISGYLDHGGLPAVEGKFGPPSATLTGVLDMRTGETGSGSLDRPGGKSYVFGWALDSQGKPVVESHRIQLQGAARPTAQDLDFASRFHDGASDLASINKYFSRLSGGRWKSVKATTTGPKTKLLVWSLPSGGFAIEDDAGMSASDSKRLELDQSGSPFGILVWDVNHVEHP